MRLGIFVVVVTLLVGCGQAGLDGGTERRDGGGGGDEDAGGGGDMDGGSSGGEDAGPISRGAIRDEICGNEFDDDDNGMIDDGCDCAVGTTRGCWLGPPESRGIGSCHDGVQTCDSAGASSSWGYCDAAQMPEREVLFNGRDDDCDGVIDEPDGICRSLDNVETGAACGNGIDDDCDTQADCDDPDCEGEARCPGGCEASETLCWGEVDDDCDGDVDCADAQCVTDPSCATGPCPPGQTPTYRERDLGASYGGSSVRAGDGQPVMEMTCEPGTCPAGQVAVILVGQPQICVPPPPECPAGTQPNYVASGVWRCDPPCDFIIHYGSIYGGQNVCAGPPDFECPAGQVPTFVEGTEVWECRRECDNTLYDRLTIDGMTICVPC